MDYEHDLFAHAASAFGRHWNLHKAEISFHFKDFTVLPRCLTSLAEQDGINKPAEEWDYMPQQYILNAKTSLITFQ